MQLHLEVGIRAEEQRVMNWAGHAQKKKRKTQGDLKRPFPRIIQDDIASRSVITAHSTKTCMQKGESQMRSRFKGALE